MNPSDRELLEKAARAAGLSVHRGNMPHQRDMLFLDAGEFSPEWNPLRDDGAALRLAVKLELSVADNGKFVFTACCNNAALRITQDKGPDRYAATRRAIVRAAAALAPKEQP